ncbi:hypothetical protein [Cupriavidus sp. USMAA2-4]|uniref:hypothetical protein n=1 Tax=Cupriavidus sp. USMAA2-4 TaxID=876364 RepID=UPI0012F4CC29|nr:hypothetical protein [Cupriavidus sp. USMAA2-4]
MKRKTWKHTVRGAHMRLRLQAERIKTWRGLWMTPAYAFFRRRVLRKEDAWSVAQPKLDALMMRRDRIARRYGL